MDAEPEDRWGNGGDGHAAQAPFVTFGQFCGVGALLRQGLGDVEAELHPIRHDSHDKRRSRVVGRRIQQPWFLWRRPVVFNQGRGIGTIWHVLGVVSAYITQAIAVTGGAGVVPTNSGIVVVYDIKHAIDAIDGFVDAGR